MQLVFTQQPFSAAAGQPILPFSVAVEDQDGNILTADNSSVRLYARPDGGRHAQCVANRHLSAKNGVATFSSISVSAKGEYTLRRKDRRVGMEPQSQAISMLPWRPPALPLRR